MIRAGIVSAVAASALGLATGPAQAQRDYYGAIAVSGNTGRIAWATDYGSYAQAQGAARSRCGSGCTVLVSFRNACGAVSYSPSRRYYIGRWGTSRPAAESSALAANGGSRIAAWACTTRYRY